MASLGDLIVRIGANVAEFDDAMAGLGRKLEDTAAKTERVYAGVDKIGTRLAEIGAITSIALTAPLVALGGAAIEAAGKMEQARIAFTTMLGSAAASTAMLKELQAFAQSTPFEFPSLVDASKKLMAMGFAAKDVIPTLRAVGDAAAGLGGGAQMIDRITIAIGQMSAKGKVSAEEMKQLAEAGIPAWDILAKKLGVTIPEAMKQAEKGMISAAEAVPAIMAGLTTKFGGMMDQQSKTLLGMWSNVKDRISATLISIGDALAPTGKAILASLDPVLKFAQGAAEAFAKLPGPVQTAAVALGALLAAIGPMTLAGGLLLKVFVDFRTMIPAIVAGLEAISAGFVTFAAASIPAATAAVIEFATVALPAAIAAVGTFSTALLAGAAASLFDFAVTAIPAAIGGMITLATSFGTATAAVASFATTGLVPALRGLAGLVSGGIMVAIEGLGSLAAAAIPAAIGALSALGVGVALLAAAFGGWKLGEWLYSNVPALKAFGDGIADLVLKIPGLITVIDWWTGAAAALSHANADLDGATVKLQKSLQNAGLDIKQGSMSNEEYAAKLRATAKSIDGVGMAAYLAGLKLNENSNEVAKNKAAYELAEKVWKEAKKQLDLGQGSAQAVALAYRQMRDAAAKAHPELQGTGSSVKFIDDQLKQLQERLGSKSIPMKLLEIADLKRRIFAPTDQDKMGQDLALLEKRIDLNRKAFTPTSDVDLNRAAEMRKNLMLAGMDTQQAFSLLGVTSSADLEREVQLVQAAYNKINDSAFASAEDVARAEIAAAEKTVQAWRTAGRDVPDSLILMLDRAKTAWEAIHMDLGQALQKLGVTSEAALANQLEVQTAALAKIRSSAAAGTATQLDLDNAEISTLEKKAAAFKTIGKQMNDDEEQRLADLKAIRENASRSLEGAFQFFGLISDADLDRSKKSIDAAFKQIADSAKTTSEQADLAAIAGLQKMIADYKRAGKTVTDDMNEELAIRTERARQAALNIQNAFAHLGVISFGDATRGIDGLVADFQKITEGANVTVRDLDNTFVAMGEKILKFARDTGAAIPEQLGGSIDELVKRIEAAKQRIALAGIDIGNAFQIIGTQSTAAIVANAEKMQRALDVINANETSSTRDRIAAQIAAEESYYAAQVAQGEKVNQLDQFNTEEKKARLKETLDYSKNIFKQLDDVFKKSFDDVRTGLVDAITGAKSFGEAFLDVAKDIEKAIVKYIINNFIITDDWINKVSAKLTNLFAGAGATATDAATDGLQKAGGALIGPAAGAGGSGATAGAGSTAGAAAGGGSSLLSTITGIAGLGVSIASGIVSGIQGAHANSLLDKIEKSTRRTDITLEGPDGVNDHVRVTRWNTAGIWTDIGSSGWFHEAFASLMSTTEAMLEQLQRITAGTGSGSPVADPNDPGRMPGGDRPTFPGDDEEPLSPAQKAARDAIDDTTQDLADFTGTATAAGTATSNLGASVGSTAAEVTGLADATTALGDVSQMTAKEQASLADGIHYYIDQLDALAKAHKVNSAEYQDTKGLLIDLSRKQAALNEILDAQGKPVVDLTGSTKELMGVSQYAIPVINGYSTAIDSATASLSAAGQGLTSFSTDLFTLSDAVTTANQATMAPYKPGELGPGPSLFNPQSADDLAAQWAPNTTGATSFPYRTADGGWSTQPGGQGLTLIFQGNTISSRQAQDDFMNSVMDKLRKNAALKI